MTGPDRTPGPLGVDALDGEHRLQLELLDSLRQAIQAGRPTADIAAVLDQLVEYSNAHFLAEQLLMRQHSYPLYEAHVQEHDRLIAHGRHIRDSVRAGETSASLALLDELRAWLVGHIDGMDRSYAEFTALEGVTPKL